MFEEFKKRSVRFFRHPVKASITIGALSLLAIFFVKEAIPSNSALSNLFEASNLGFRDVLARTYPAEKLRDEIIIVAIDDQTLSDKEGGLGRWQDFKRSYYAKVVDQLKADGAAVVGVDVLFSEKSDSGDDVLAASVSKAGNVVLGFSKAQGLYPLPELKSAAASLGYFEPIVNRSNGTVYSISPSSKTKDGVSESFSFAVLREYLDGKQGIRTEVSERNRDAENVYLFHEGAYSQVRYQKDFSSNSVLVRYLPANRKFPTVSFSDVFHAESVEGRYGSYDPEMVKGKIVLIGATATALHDEFITPVGTIAGVLVHANMINSVLNYDSSLADFSPAIENLLFVLLALLVPVLLFSLSRSAAKSVISGASDSLLAALLAFSATVFALSFSVIAYRTVGMVFTKQVELILTVFFSTSFTFAVRYWLEGKTKSQLNRALGEYLAKDLVSQVLRDYDDGTLEPKRAEGLTLFFSDIAGFTTLSETMEPEDLVKNFLSRYLEGVSNVILDREGFINKYEGDAVMAIWGAFRPKGLEPTDHEVLQACRATVEQQEAVARMNVDFHRDFGVEIVVRMGLNYGPAVLWNIGSKGRKLEYTALGDTVNTASRFEGINKLYGTKICVGEGVREKAKSEFLFRRLDLIMVKGKEKPTPIFELVCRLSDAKPETFTLVSEFERGLSAYAEGRVSEGQKIFVRLWNEFRDPPSEVFMNRCGKLIEEGVPEGWIGAYRATEK